LTVENHDVAPVRFGCSALTLTSRDGKSWPVVLEERTLAIHSPEVLRRSGGDPLAPHPLATLREAVARAPIFDPSVEVAPGGFWQGAVVFDVACAQVGETPLLPATFSFRLTPGREAPGACIEERSSRRWPRGYGDWLGGSSATASTAPELISV